MSTVRFDRNSEARKRHEAAECGCVPNPAGGFPLSFCARHLPRTDPAAIGLVLRPDHEEQT